MAEALAIAANAAQVATFCGVFGFAAFKVVKRIRFTVVVLPKDDV